MKHLGAISRANHRAAVALGHGRYPHMSPEDTAVWESYLVGNRPDLGSVSYDLTLGDGARLYPGDDENHASHWARLVRKRVDAVVTYDDSVWVVEVKPIAGMSALGQVLSYSHLFEAEYGSELLVIPVIVAHFLDWDLVPLFEDLGVSVLLPAWSQAGRRELECHGVPLV